jgi:hypothetical protein
MYFSTRCIFFGICKFFLSYDLGESERTDTQNSYKIGPFFGDVIQRRLPSSHLLFMAQPSFACGPHLRLLMGHSVIPDACGEVAAEVESLAGHVVRVSVTPSGLRLHPAATPAPASGKTL